MTLRPPSDPAEFRTQIGRYRERWYIDRLPADGTWEPMTDAVPSVSTVKGAWPKFLTKWAASEAATCAVSERETWERMDDRAAVDYIAKASDRSRDRAADRGSAIHAVIESIAEGQEPMFVDAAVDPYMDAITKLLDDLGPIEPVAVESVVIARGPMGYGGTLDAIWNVPSLGGVWLFDWKSRKAGKADTAWEEEAAQLVAYATADYLIGESDGQAVRQPIPELDGMAIVAIAPDGYRIHPVKEG